MDFSVLISVLLFIFVIFLVVLVISLNSKLTKLTEKKDDTSSLLIQNQLNSLVNNLDNKLSETNRIIQDQLSSSNSRLQQQSSINNDLLHKISENNNKILQQVTEKLVKVEDTNTQIMNFAEQLQSLENILQNPKQRGVLGEYFLETMLSNILPKAVYRIQYPFKDGVIVDAVIFASDKIIPIDAKFSLDGYNRIINCKDKNNLPFIERDFLRDIKLRVDETSKYVKPEENTIDVAFMFVPSDSVYHEIIRIGCENDIATDIISYAYSKKVVIVSPTSFFGYLQILLKGLKTMQIEAQIGEVVKHLNESAKYLKAFEEEMNKLGKNIITLSNSYNRTSDKARLMSKRIGKVTGNEENILDLEKVEHIEN